MTTAATVNCPSCSAKIAANSKFCSQCGGKVEKKCPGCGATHPLTAKFCSQCGTGLSGGNPPPPAKKEEKEKPKEKQVQPKKDQAEPAKPKEKPLQPKKTKPKKKPAQSSKKKPPKVKPVPKSSPKSEPRPAPSTEPMDVESKPADEDSKADEAKPTPTGNASSEAKAAASAAAAVMQEAKAAMADDDLAWQLVDKLAMQTMSKKEMQFYLEECKNKAHAIEQKMYKIKEAPINKNIRRWLCPEKSVPIRADVRTFDFQGLVDAQVKLTGKKFDLIMTDPPWQLASANPTRGVAISYDCLPDLAITNLPIPILQDNGFLMIWVINSKYDLALRMMEKWGYKLVDDITWVKMTVNRRIARGHGFYLQHAFESCLVGLKGDPPPGSAKSICSDLIYSMRRGQSQKPVEIYEYAERLVPNGHYLEIFGRRNNVRDYWVTIGNEI